MKQVIVLIVALCAELPVQAQLTTDQKIQDFRTMADQFAKRYAALSWKNTLFGVDMLNIQSFLDRVTASQDDLEFYEICVDYVAQAHDGGHVFFEAPSDFIASMNFFVDMYDGKPLIYSINRLALPSAQFPFQIGDELVSIDGTSAANLMASLYKYGTMSTDRTGAGYAAQALTYRPQSVIPHAINVPDSSTVVIRRQSGVLETYTIPWTKTGVPLLNEGPVPGPRSSQGAAKAAGSLDIGAPNDPAGQLAPLYSMLPPERGVAGVGSLAPVFILPAGFKLRLGRNLLTDAFYSGTYQSNGHTIGFIRIPSFNPSIGVPAALAELDAEINFFQNNTDGLIVDDMRNPGGLVYYGEEVARRLMPAPFRLVGFDLRPTREFVNSFYSYVARARTMQLSPDIVAFYGSLLDDVNAAYSQDGGLTDPLPLDTIYLNPLPNLPSLDEMPI